MTTRDARTFDAATRVLATAAADPQHYTDAEADYAAWLVGRGGGSVPAFTDPVAQRLAEMAAAFGAHRDDDAIALLEAAVADEDRGATYVMPLIHACYLAGDRIPDRIIDVIQRYPAHASNAVSGELLVRTTRPADLLALYANRTDDRAIRMVGELVIFHRDAGTPLPAAEAHWAKIEAAWPERGTSHNRDLLADQIRMAVRGSLEAGIDKLVRGHASYQWEKVWPGVIAVLARLVRANPAAAVQLVLGTNDPTLPPPEPYEMVPWVRALAWWFELPPQAEPVVEACLGPMEPERHRELAGWLVAARALPWLDRAIAGAGEQPPLAWARTLAAETKRLREAGHIADAELVRERAARVAPSELDLFDVRSAAELPRAFAWMHGADLP